MVNNYKTRSFKQFVVMFDEFFLVLFSFTPFNYNNISITLNIINNTLPSTLIINPTFQLNPNTYKKHTRNTNSTHVGIVRKIDINSLIA